ncbi:MAG: sigma-70 family RNA polymerase sigma factor [Flavobacteriia bacterium]|nr:sigma-70 family RNA polymerase sigma factor [Flavobacteriia bacterium]
MFFGNRRKYQQLSDKELIDLYITDRCSYTLPLLYERYGHLVMGSCMKYLRQVENAEDITMRIFGELSAKLLKHDIQHFKSWLYQVTRNECLQFLRKHKPGNTTMIDELSQPQDESLEETVALETEHLSIPLNTVKSAIQNGKRNLKIWMERQASHEV